MKFKEAGLVSGLVPPGVAAADLDDDGQPVALHPLEAGHVAGAVETRRRDFALGRYCARAALAGLGLDGVVIGRDGRGRPLWPAGFVGSITHTRTYAAAVAAPQDRFLSVGVDAERSGGITDAMLPMLFDDAERRWLQAFDGADRTPWATVLFSAKEATFKAWNMATNKPLAFRDLHIDIEPDQFIVRQEAAGDWGGPVTGRFALRGDLVVTCLCVPKR